MNQTEKKQFVIKSGVKAGGACYFHHQCPEDGYFADLSKRQCRNKGKAGNKPRAHSWKPDRNSLQGCESF